ncbi:MAG: DUF2809 domain-containing protein [Calothrix sp. FI2-JRJ7]|nr:DUF2809 domain-containing protein [Calothrix sp. FI2-JRJ7]
MTNLACLVEILQYFNFVNKLGLQNNRILAVALGSTFDWKDIIAYAIGTIIILALDFTDCKLRRRQ